MAKLGITRAQRVGGARFRFRDFGNKCAAAYSSHSMGRMEKNQTARRVLQLEFGSVS